MNWSNEEISRMMVLFYTSKRSCREIGEALGKTRESVKQKLYNLRRKGFQSDDDWEDHLERSESNEI